MSTENIEYRITDTTANVDIHEDSESFSICCDKCFENFSINDHGVSPVLKLCRACYTELQSTFLNVDTLALTQNANEKQTLDKNLSATFISEPIFADVAVSDSSTFNSLTSNPITPDYQTPDYTSFTSGGTAVVPEGIDEIEGAMIMASKTKEKAFTTVLNGKNESFEFIHDPINGTAFRMLFRRKSCSIRLLYWYNLIGAMLIPTKKKIKGCMLLITPCVVQLHSTEDTHLLLICLETMCNRPRYDGLLINMRTKVASIQKEVLSTISEILLVKQFDEAEMERLTNYILHHPYYK